MKNKISVCIPTYEMAGQGVKYLKHSLDILTNQNFKNFNVVISDHSLDDNIEKTCKEYQEVLSIKYLRNDKKRGSSSANINNAISNADGDIIKILFQDDFLYSKNSLKEIVDNFDINKDKWLVTSSEHTKDGTSFIKKFNPKYNRFIHLGLNTISSPSVLAFLNKNPLLFDENLIWLMDVDYYKRCYNKFGKPKIVNKINIVNRLSENQLTNKITKKIKKQEYKYIIKKHERGLYYYFFIATSFLRFIRF